MSGAETFFDTSTLLYLISADTEKADRVESLLAKGGVISVQVLNEFTAAATRKRALSLPEAREFLNGIRSICNVEPLTVETHDRGIEIAERYAFSLYDSMIVAAALLAGCKWLYSEDLQHRQLIERRLRVMNPFKGPLLAK